MERRNSSRLPTRELFVQERNGDYLFTLAVENLSEEGMFVRGKMVTDDHHYVSYLTFRLPNGAELENVPAKIIRETFSADRNGVVFHFVSMDEDMRIQLKKFLMKSPAA